ncbi:MAG TPA: glycosyltransferase family A protein [Acidobacteriota bacterium]|nr:glycosyltransferase family A protein [Acidobacteriota bacterium]
MITAITPTGDRPLAFRLCQQWMRHQTLKADQWIVVDDGKKPLTKTKGFDYIRREPKKSDPKFTLIENLKIAMPYIKGNKILIIEDDEYYSPYYIETMSKHLSKHEVVGIGNSKYYHLPSGGNFTIGNMKHASLAETGFRRSFLSTFKELLNQNNVYIDVVLWRKANGFIFTDSKKNPLYLGIKGLAGRRGIGRGHDPLLYKKFPPDISRSKLKKWIPKDYQIYMDVIKGSLTDKNCEDYFA